MAVISLPTFLVLCYKFLNLSVYNLFIQKSNHHLMRQRWEYMLDWAKWHFWERSRMDGAKDVQGATLCPHWKRLTQHSYRWFLTHCAVSEKASAVLYWRDSQHTTAALCSVSCQSLLPTTQTSPGAPAFPTLVSFVLNTLLSLDFCIFLCLFPTLLYHSVLKSTLFQSSNAL